MACPVKGQVKKQLTEADYKLWSTLEINQLSEKGNWVSYSLYNETAGDTLFVRNTTNLKTFAFPGSAGGKFAADNAFVVRANNGDVLLKNLNNGSEQRFSNIGNYSVTLGGKFVIMHRKDESVSGDLLVVGTDGTELLKLPNVSLYTLNPDRTQLVCDSGKKLHLVNLKKIQPVKVIDTVEREYTRFVWQNNGLSFGWCSGKDMVAVGLYRIRDGKSYTFDRSKFGDFPVNGVIANPDGLELKISDDGARIFFNVMVIKPATDSTGVQIWNTADKMLYAARAAFNNISDVLKLAVWFPDAEKFRMVTNDRYPRIIQIPGQSYALVYNPLDNEPQFDSDAPINYYLQNITTGQQDLLLSDQSANVKTLEISKNGKYIAYFRNNHWCLYDIKSGMHRNLTAKISGEFTHEKYDRSGEKAVCGIAGWTENGSEVMIYDSYDIWLFKTDGTKAVRLTNGREHNVVYRIVSKSPHGLIGSDFNSTLNLAEGLLLRAVSDTKNGYYNYSLKYGLQEMVYENNRIDSIKQSENGAFCYLTEHYHLAPQLIFKPKNQKSIMLYESNRHQKNYEWGFSKLISYENSQGKPLLGALFYPAGYDADKKYPMIVHIYERQSDQFNQYVNPTLHNADGFNVTNYTTQGYFVLLPDIAYTDGKTGSSALDCVSAAVNEVLAHESIDADRLGLVGHSFGGYETNFIVTQTNKFAAAISGAGVSDIVSSYLTVGSANKKPDGWRYEFNQFRIGASLFDSYETYIQNSPITFAKQISTPLLLWSGENDTSINYSQSLEMHLALRRLQKPNIFLLYEQGGHSLMKKDDQIDLTYRMQDWFNFYLKDGIRPTWFKTDKL